jgi:hypothetical protein
MAPSIMRTGLFLAVLWFAVPAIGAEVEVGSIKSAQGGVVIRRGADRIPVREGMHVQLNDVLETAVDGRVGLILQDGTRLALGPNSELNVNRFVYQPADGKFALILRLGRGILAYVSGKIAQFSPQSVSVETPAGVLGLRGTEIAISIEGS